MKQNNEKTALIVEGGAMRSIFAAGLLDGLIELDTGMFDLFIGVSGGAFNLLTYLQQKPGLTLDIINRVLNDDTRLVDLKRFIRGGNLIDIDLLVNLVCNHPELDTDTIFQHSPDFHIGLTAVDSGKAHLVAANPQNIATLLRASAALPLLFRHFPLHKGIAMTDGGIADGLPVARAIEMGARRILLIRSRHHSYHKRDTLMHRYIRWRLRKHSRLVSTMARRVEIFEDSCKLITNPPPHTRILDIGPPAAFSMPRFSFSARKIRQGYTLGRQMAADVNRQWRSLLAQPR